MLKTYIATAMLGSALLAPLAFAETATTPGANATANTTSASYQGDWRASKIVGVNVYNNNNENVGSINDLLTDKNGTIKAVIIGVGGFLGMGEHLVAVAFDKIKFVDEPLASSAANVPNTRPPGASTTTGAATNTNPAPATTTTASTKSDWYPDHAVYNTTKDELKAMPQFSYSK
jgi:sporulation protein YlmC with PRC-barrel domain